MVFSKKAGQHKGSLTWTMRGKCILTNGKLCGYASSGTHPKNMLLPWYANRMTFRNAQKQERSGFNLVLSNLTYYSGDQ